MRLTLNINQYRLTDCQKRLILFFVNKGNNLPVDLDTLRIMAGINNITVKGMLRKGWLYEADGLYSLDSKLLAYGNKKAQEWTIKFNCLEIDIDQEIPIL